MPILAGPCQSQACQIRLFSRTSWFKGRCCRDGQTEWRTYHERKTARLCSAVRPLAESEIRLKSQLPESNSTLNCWDSSRAPTASLSLLTTTISHRHHPERAERTRACNFPDPRLRENRVENDTATIALAPNRHGSGLLGRHHPARGGPSTQPHLPAEIAIRPRGAAGRGCL